MSCVWMLQRGHSGDVCVLASTLCKYDLRKGDLFVLSWARVRRVFFLQFHCMTSGVVRKSGLIFSREDHSKFCIPQLSHL